MTALIVLKSMTEAGKARYHLEKFKIEAIVEKTTTHSGSCCYGIRVREDSEKVCRLLGLVNIDCVEIRT